MSNRAVFENLRLVVFATTAIVFGCVDLPTAPPFGTAPPALTRTQLASTPDISKLQPFDIALQAVGGVSSAEPITLRISISSHVDADATFSVFSPEFESARAGSWNSMVRPQGSIPSLTEWQQRATTNAVIDRSIALSVERPGYYRIVIRAVLDKTDREAGGPFNDGTIRTFWLLVTENGGAVLTTPDPSRVPAEFRPSFGMFEPARRPDMARRPGPIFTRASLALHQATMDTVICNGICGTLRYVNYAEGAYANVGPATLIIQEYDSWGTLLSTDFEFATDQGEFTIPCPSGSNRHKVFPGLGNADVEMLVPDVFWVFSDDCGGTSDWFLDDENAHFYTIAKYGVAASKAAWGHSAAKTLVAVVSYASYPLGEYRINVNGAEAFTRGEFSVGHEYGHLVIDRVFGGLPAGWDTCPDPHFPYNPSTPGCAYSEGLATAHAMDVFGSMIESIDYSYYENVQDYDPGTDGLIYEASVARYLTDVLDPIDLSEPADELSLPASFLVGNLTSCSVSISGSWVPDNGVDHLHFCFEDAVDTNLTGSYFWTRTNQPMGQISQSDGLSGVQIQALRETLLYTLYGQ